MFQNSMWRTVAFIQKDSVLNLCAPTFSTELTNFSHHTLITMGCSSTVLSQYNVYSSQFNSLPCVGLLPSARPANCLKQCDRFSPKYNLIFQWLSSKNS